MDLYTYTIHRQRRMDFTKQFAAVDQAEANQQLTHWIDTMNFEEPITTSVVVEPLPEATAFYLSGSAEYDDEGDPICGDWQKWKLLSLQHLRSLSVEQTEEGKSVEFYRSDYTNTDNFLRSLASHRYPDRADEVPLEKYSQAIDQWATYLHEQVNLQLARAFNDRPFLNAHTAWWKLITPEALIILITEKDTTTHTIHIHPHSPLDDELGYEFQLDRVSLADEITLDEFRTHLQVYIDLFSISLPSVATNKF